MIENLNSSINLTFFATILLSIVLFYKAIEEKKYANLFLIISSCWLALQLILSYSGFYLNTNAIPPRIFFAVVPAFIFILIVLVKGKSFIHSLSLSQLTFLHIVRIPVELVLYWLFINEQVPELMTFAGRNFDILAGLTAPLIVYFGFVKQSINRKIILIWNFFALGLLINIVVNAALSVPSVLQQFAFDQPNVAILYLPYIALPSLIVPLVFMAHIVCIKKLMNQKSASSFFTLEQEEQIMQAIINAEKNTSGEIRLHIEKTCDDSPLERAKVVFATLKMHKTKARNGVLFYLATSSKKFAIYGDEGINKVVPSDFWETTKNKMKDTFSDENYTQGIVEAITEAGIQLKKHFPYQSNDKNELSNEISVG